MFGLFSRPTPRTRRASRRPVRLELEHLETRDCPSLSVTLDAVVLNDAQLVKLSGTVTGDGAGCSGVDLSGPVSDFVMADSSGYFELITSAGGLGTVYATAMVMGGGGSATTQAELTNEVPSLTFDVTYDEQNFVTLTGQVTDEAPGGLSVYFSGAVGDAVTTNADGSFSLTTAASALGAVQATVTDVWGQEADSVEQTLTSDAPIISNFQVTKVSGDIWQVTGQVIDESAYGLTVILGGVVSGEVSVGSDGCFCYDVSVNPGTTGNVTAQTTDWWGLLSGEATYVA